MRAVITVVGKDKVGIFAKVSTFCADHNININGVSQTILDDMFVMIMSITVDKCTIPFGEFADSIKAFGGHPRHARGHFQFHAPHLKETEPC